MYVRYVFCIFKESFRELKIACKKESASIFLCNRPSDRGGWFTDTAGAIPVKAIPINSYRAFTAGVVEQTI